MHSKSQRWPSRLSLECSHARDFGCSSLWTSPSRRRLMGEWDLLAGAARRTLRSLRCMKHSGMMRRRSPGLYLLLKSSCTLMKASTTSKMSLDFKKQQALVFCEKSLEVSTRDTLHRAVRPQLLRELLSKSNIPTSIKNITITRTALTSIVTTNSSLISLIVQGISINIK